MKVVELGAFTADDEIGPHTVEAVAEVVERIGAIGACVRYYTCWCGVIICPIS